MKKTLVLLGLLMVSQYGHAQHVISIYDGEGKEVGTPHFGSPTQTHATVIRPDGLAMNLDLADGFISPVTHGIVYAEPDCAGQPFVWSQVLYLDWIAPVDIPDQPDPVALFPRNSYQLIQVKSRPLTPGCENLDEIRYGFPATFIDPADYGLVKLDFGDFWGYPGPLEIRATKVTSSGQAIFCNGFENCPQQ